MCVRKHWDKHCFCLRCWHVNTRFKGDTDLLINYYNYYSPLLYSHLSSLPPSN